MKIRKIICIFLVIVIFQLLGKSAAAQQPQTQDAPATGHNTEPIFGVNSKWNQGVGVGYWLTAGAGLVVNVTPGTCFDSSDTRHAFGGGTISVSNGTNYVDLNNDTCAVEISTSTYQSRRHLGTVVASGGVIVPNGITEDRTWFIVSSGIGGVVTHTGNYTMQASDAGKLTIMNCSSACTVTLYGTPSSTYFAAVESIGSTVAAVSLNSLNFNGASSIPPLLSYQILGLWSDGTNYFGSGPLVAGTNISFTPASNGLTISGTASGATITGVQQNSYTCANDTGTANAYVVSVSPTPTVVTYSAFCFKAANGNNAPSTVAVNGGSATAIKKNGTTALTSGDIATGQIVWVQYDGTNYQMVSWSGVGKTITVERAIPFTIFNPSGLASGTSSASWDLETVPFGCTIVAYDLSIDAGTITVKFWKIASGTAIPTVSNSISTSGVGISSGTHVHSTTLTDFTTLSVTQYDIMIMDITAVTSATFVNGVLQCNESF